jgi:hypothetical protein
MELDRRGREYVTWSTDAPDDLPLEVTFDGAVWYATERPTADEVRLLLAGPAATGNPTGTAVLALGENRVTFRGVDAPEIVFRGAGSIRVY